MSRMTQVHRILERKHLDAIIILSDYNRRYLSGFTGTNEVLITPKNRQYLITDFRYIDQATKQAPNREIINNRSTIIGEVRELPYQENFENVGFEGHHVSYDAYLELDKGRISLISISNTVDKTRDVKDTDKIALIQRAADIVDETCRYILMVTKAGMTERELKAMLENKTLELGADGPSFDMIIAPGHRGALPHGVASGEIVEKSNMVALNSGTYFNGYRSDITKTFAIGGPDPKLREMYQIALESQMRAINEIRPSIVGAGADAISGSHLESRGYGEEFRHSLGRGIGLEIREGPILARTIQDRLQVNNCVTVGPGVYIEGLGDIRIGDDILITESDRQVLTKCTKDLIVLT